jgi:hypothetical protein
MAGDQPADVAQRDQRVVREEIAVKDDVVGEEREQREDDRDTPRAEIDPAAVAARLLGRGSPLPPAGRYVPDSAISSINKCGALIDPSNSRSLPTF